MFRIQVKEWHLSLRKGEVLKWNSEPGKAMPGFREDSEQG